MSTATDLFQTPYGSPVPLPAEVVKPPISIAIGPWYEGPVQEVGEFATGNLALTLNQGHQLTFAMPGRSPAAHLVDGMVTDVWLYVDDKLDGRFRTLPLAQSWGASGEDEVAVMAVSYKRLLNWRFLHAGLKYTQVDQGDIVWSLVSHTQAQPGGNLGITKGYTSTGVVRDRTYLEGDNIFELGDNLSGVERGCWWDIDYAGRLEAAMYDDFPVHPTPLVLGANALALERTPPGTFANAVMASGSDEQTVPVWWATTTVATDPRGRWEATTSSPNTIHQNTLNEHARGYLSWSARPAAVWTAEVSPRRWRNDSSYHPGDRIVITVPPSAADPLAPITPGTQVLAQVTECAATFDSNGALAITVSAIEGVASGTPSSRVAAGGGTPEHASVDEILANQVQE